MLKSVGDFVRECIGVVNSIEMQAVAILLAVLGSWLVAVHHGDDGKLLIGGALALLQHKTQ
jgi:hypothetical protein